jgi:cysteine-rich repeat protein
VNHSATTNKNWIWSQRDGIGGENGTLFYLKITIEACPYLCGDSMLAAGEVCDNGMMMNEAGCNPSCSGVNPGWYCYNTDSVTPSVCSTLCGDGKVAGIETCDDGLADLSGCNSTCDGTVAGWTCTGGNANSPSTCKTTCGDGTLVAGHEECDDANANSGDGCSSSCQIEEGWNCTTGGVACTPKLDPQCTSPNITHPNLCLTCATGFLLPLDSKIKCLSCSSPAITNDPHCSTCSRLQMPQIVTCTGCNAGYFVNSTTGKC